MHVKMANDASLEEETPMSRLENVFEKSLTFILTIARISNLIDGRNILFNIAHFGI
jgi:hypothetical protein